MIKKPVIRADEAAAKIRPGDVVHLGGFLGCGCPDAIVKALVAAGTKGLTLVCNDTGIFNEEKGRSTGPAPLIKQKAFKTMIVSHIGTNPETQRQMNSGESEVLLVPQGTLAERVRAAGNGLGGVLTPTGVGTEVEQGKQKIRLNGKDFLLEEALPGNVALIKAKKADEAGNLVYAKTARNFNPLMASACTVVIAEVEELVAIGSIDPDQVHTPSIFVDYIVMAE
ncbi:MAG: CoA transferase subunit A [Spirochaetes bacterium]|nr:CoA transferase subunit A [Spirochaetota bacterium]MBU1079780.1 CoA transferase subunit A [Spirochaetota bacterium]